MAARPCTLANVLGTGGRRGAGRTVLLHRELVFLHADGAEARAHYVAVGRLVVALGYARDVIEEAAGASVPIRTLIRITDNPALAQPQNARAQTQTHKDTVLDTKTLTSRARAPS